VGLNLLITLNGIATSRPLGAQRAGGIKQIFDWLEAHILSGLHCIPGTAPPRLRASLGLRLPSRAPSGAAPSNDSNFKALGVLEFYRG